MSCVEVYNMTDFMDELEGAYNKSMNMHFFIGGVLMLTTLTNMSFLCNITQKINEIRNNYMPPTYKVML